MCGVGTSGVLCDEIRPVDVLTDISGCGRGREGPGSGAERDMFGGGAGRDEAIS